MNRKLEKNSLLRLFLNKVFIHPFLNDLQPHNQSKVRKTHRSAEEIIEHKTTHKALEVLYLGGYREESKSFKERLFHFVWMHTDNAKGVRNRLKITEQEIEKHIRYLYNEKHTKDVRLLSIASGSARSFLEVFKRLHDLKGLRLHLTFLDKNPYALEYSKGLFATKDFSSNKYSFEWIEATANVFLNSLKSDNYYHVVEMVGLMDYFDNEKVSQTCNSIYSHLHNNGCFVTANIIPNNEQPFVTNVVGWRMIYRQPDEFALLVRSAPFKKDNITMNIEPLRVHTIITAVKK